MLTPALDGKKVSVEGNTPFIHRHWSNTHFLNSRFGSHPGLRTSRCYYPKVRHSQLTQAFIFSMLTYLTDIATTSMCSKAETSDISLY